MVKTLELAVARAALLPEAAQEQIGRELLERIDALADLRAAIDIGIRELDPRPGRGTRHRRAYLPGARGGTTTSRRVVWAPKAKQDLRQIHRYYSREASSEIADNLLRAIDETATRIAARPFARRPRDELIPGLRSALVHPYTIFFRVGEDRVEIVRVLHERRDFPATFGKTRNPK